MKEKLSVKKIVLASIGALSALLLLISMSFFYVYNPSLPSEANITGMTAENGFSMMGFESVLFATDDLAFSGVLMGIASYLMFIGAIGGFALTILPLFLCSEKKAKKLVTMSIVINACISIVYLIVGIIAVSGINAPIKEAMDALSEATGGVVDDSATKALLCSTATFWAVILQALALIAYILCDKLIKAQKPQAVVAIDGAEKTEKVESKPAMSYAEKENKIIELLTKYKEIYMKGIITVMDFEKKKYVLMFDNKHINLELEGQLVETLVSYRKIYDEEIITHDEYEKKKLQILASK